MTRQLTACAALVLAGAAVVIAGRRLAVFAVETVEEAMVS